MQRIPNSLPRKTTKTENSGSDSPSVALTVTPDLRKTRKMYRFYVEKSKRRSLKFEGCGDAEEEDGGAFKRGVGKDGGVRFFSALEWQQQQFKNNNNKSITDNRSCYAAPFARSGPNRLRRKQALSARARCRTHQAECHRPYTLARVKQQRC
ncbi:hypothetical protein MRB53_008713 [Persea americana]|uniref:Uncharacterized protein n=1 Tax=Persea americana TaxID=3435 RepID=A0ACC2MMV1_PERAE|nr:hypothetical protein MRB53_008713 [Persea americana]